MTARARFAGLGVEEYQACTAVELGRRVADGSLSPVQLTECALHLASEAEPVINAYAVLLPEQLRRWMTSDALRAFNQAADKQQFMETTLRPAITHMTRQLKAAFDEVARPLEVPADAHASITSVGASNVVRLAIVLLPATHVVV